MTTDKGQSLAHCGEPIAIVGLKQILCRVFEHREHIGVHKLEVGQDILGGSSDDILRLRDTNSLKFDACLPLDILNEILGLRGVEGDTDTTGTSTSGTA